MPSRNLVFLWPRSYLDSYTERQSVDPMGKTGFNRAFYSQMIFKPFDGTGRIVLPGELAGKFPDREILIVGTSGMAASVWGSFLRRFFSAMCWPSWGPCS